MKPIQLSSQVAANQDFIAVLNGAFRAAEDAIGVCFSVVNASLYGSVVKGKLTPNDIDVFAEITLTADLELAESIGFEFDEELSKADTGSDVYFQASRFLTELVHDFLHGAYPEFKQPVFNGTPVDICVSMMNFDDFWGVDCSRTTIQMQ